ncbi:MAG TPA: TetR family transcriptional regulator [Thermoanaerobaculia bacterium]|nr:TetR family transcriptional regulator [Thermoanaerobaculia bacterium]
MTTTPENRIEHATRESLLDAAEALFAEHGIQAASLRAITQKAGANLAAVHYHCGSKEGLVKAVFSRRLKPLNQERLRLLEACDLAAADGVEQVLRAFLAPVLRMSRETPGGAKDFAQLMGRAFTEPGEEVKQVLMEELGEMVDRFLAAFGGLLPHLPETERIWRFHFVAGAMGHVIGCGQLLQRYSGIDCSNPDEALRILVSFLAAGLRAPASAGAPMEGDRA